MGNLISYTLLNEDVYWPPNHANKKHWCFAPGNEGGQHWRRCNDPHVGEPQCDADFDYSIFRCREARCQTCLDLNPELYPAKLVTLGARFVKIDPQSRAIHVTGKSLLESTSSGCEICSVLKEGISLVGGSTVLIPENVFCVELLQGFTVRVTHEKDTGPGRLVIKERLVVELYSSVDGVTSVPWNAFGAANRLNGIVDVIGCVKFITDSFEKCFKHQECVQNHPSSASKLPTRLIDVGTGENDVKLETSPKTVERYITLSHAWGTLPLITTTTSNLRQHCENIPWASLTRSFQDAIAITRGLKVRYIWIDSLCIIQDSSSDWEAEARDMANVYANSYLTLAATSAAESSDGLLRPRYNLNEENIREDLCEYEIKRSDGQSHFSIYCRRAAKYSHLFLLSLEPRGANRELAPLLGRAWAFQERILSPKTVHFSFDEMVWECKAGFDCECSFGSSPSGKSLSVGSHGLNSLKKLFNNTQSANMHIYDETHKATYENELFLAWYRLVEYYASLNITFSSDRLPALKGLTKTLEDKFGWTFLEGLWLEDFLPGLMWERNVLRSYRRNKAVPSWSWASMEPEANTWDNDVTTSYPKVNDVVNFDHSTCTVHERFRLIAHSARLSEDSLQYQKIIPQTQAYIVVEADFINTTFVWELGNSETRQDPKTENEDSEVCSEFKEEKKSDLDEEAETGAEHKNLVLSVKGDTTLISPRWDLSLTEVDESDELVAILLTQGDALEADSYGLLLNKVIGGLDIYKRVGFFSISKKVGTYVPDGTRRVVLV